MLDDSSRWRELLCARWTLINVRRRQMLQFQVQFQRLFGFKLQWTHLTGQRQIVRALWWCWRAIALGWVEKVEDLSIGSEDHVWWVCEHFMYFINLKKKWGVRIMQLKAIDNLPHPSLCYFRFRLATIDKLQLPSHSHDSASMCDSCAMSIRRLFSVSARRSHSSCWCATDAASTTISRQSHWDPSTCRPHPARYRQHRSDCY